MNASNSSSDTPTKSDSHRQGNESISQRDEILAILSHEMRNPLSAITFAVDCLLQDSQLSAIQQKFVDIIDRQSIQLTKLLQDLQDASFAARHPIADDLVVHDLNQSIQEVIDGLEPKISQKQQTLNVQLGEAQAWVNGDIARLKQVLVNLLENASKYTPEQGKIWLSTSLYPGGVLVSVRDTGVGMPPEILEEIFELFYRTNPPNHPQVGGLGVGLYLVQQIVTAHLGTVEAASAGAGQGSEFTIRLPAASDPAIAPSATLAPNFAGRRAILVSPDADTRDSLTHLLQQSEMEVIAVADAAAVSAALTTMQFDVALVDFIYPDGNESELVRLLRDQFPLRNCALIALTSKHGLANSSSGLNSVWDAELVKPIRYEQLINTLDRLLNEHEM